MDPNQKGLTLEESIKQVMHTLPPPIRNYLGQGKYSGVAKHLMEKYGLHIDQGTVLEREIMLLLMGIENPDEFIQTLVGEGRLDTQTVNNIIRDVNEQIFIPLRDEMRRSETTQAPAKAAVPSYKPPASPVLRPTPPPPNPRPPMPPPRPQPVPPPPPPPQQQRPSISWQPQEKVLIPANPSLPPRELGDEEVISRFSPPRSHPPASSASGRTTQGTAPVPGSRPQASVKPIDNKHLLADHEEPHIELSGTPARPPVNRLNWGAPPNLPGAMPPPAPARPKPPPPPAAPYSSDPYRESIE